MQLLVSVQDPAEALAAAAAGADLIDLKDPAAGALGGLPPARIAAIVGTLRASAIGAKLSATIGDHPASALEAIAGRVAAVAACGVDLVKVGIEQGTPARPLLRLLADAPARVVPVFVADRSIDWAAVDAALALGTFPALMLDTADKAGGSLLARHPPEALARFVGCVRGAGARAGLAGALRASDVPALRALEPDFAGFRSAVCDGGRAGALQPARVRALAAELGRRAPAAGAATG